MSRFPNFALTFAWDILATILMTAVTLICVYTFKLPDIIDSSHAGEMFFALLVPSVGFAACAFNQHRKLRQAQTRLDHLRHAVRQKKLVESQRERLAALGEISGGVAHEISNALQPVLGLSEILNHKANPTAAETHRYAKTIISSALHARTILQNSLIFIRQDEGALHPFPVSELLQEMAEHAQSFFTPDMQVVIEKRTILKAARNYQVVVDRTGLFQVTSNLYKNAMDAMKGSGSVYLSAEIRSETNPEETLDGPFLFLSIRDTGIGMDEQTLARLFDPFFTTKPAGQGTGLGMAVVKGIVKSWGGKIKIETKPGRGTTVTILIPVRENIPATPTPHTGE